MSVDTTRLRNLASAIKRQTTNRDILELCELALSFGGKDCPVCKARTQARTAAQRKWRAKDSVEF